MDCRRACAACCIAPSITSPIPGMPDGKPAGVACVQLDDDLNCRLFDDPRRPAFCKQLAPSKDMCGNDRSEAFVYLYRLEQLTGRQ